MSPQVMTNPHDFRQCLKEAWKLNNQYFSPELDSLFDGTVGSILFKVLTEWDLLAEGESHFDGVPHRSAEAWKKKVKLFMQKWREYVEVDSERQLYNKF